MLNESGTGIVYYGSQRCICTPAGGRKWLYEQYREEYVRTGAEEALTKMLALAEQEGNA